MKPHLRRVRLFLPFAIASVLTAPGSASVIHFNLDSVFDYDIVGTANEDSATGGTKVAYSALGDHNGNRAASWQTPVAYVDQASADAIVGAGSTAWPTNGLIAGGKYQLSTAFDNGTDYLTPVDNAISFQSNFGNSINDISKVVTLSLAEQQQYTWVNVVFTAYKQSNHSGGFQSSILAEYTDGSTEMLVDTGLQTGDGGTFGGALVLGGGITNSTDDHTFANQAPNYPGTIGANLVLGMDARLASAGIAAGTASLWEFDTNLAVDSTKVLESLTIRMRAPNDSANRDGSLFVMAISGNAVPEPATMGLLLLAGAVALGAARRRRH